MKDLPVNVLQQLVVELGAIGEGSLEYLNDLIHTISHPEETPVRPESEPWCKCGVCVAMPDPDHNKCCERVVCVTSYQIFRKICIDRDILKLQIMARCDLQAELMDFTTNSMRKAAYQQFVLWKHGRLGRGNRRILPSCVLKMVLKSYPDPNYQYMGFKPN